MEESGDYKKIYVNKGIRNEFPNAVKNNRPDIMGVRMNDLVNQFEVPSKTDNPFDLVNRMMTNQEMMGDRAGTIQLLEIK